jgi:hypothetical protein
MRGRHGDQGGDNGEASIGERRLDDAEYLVGPHGVCDDRRWRRKACPRCRHCGHNFSSATGTILAVLNAPTKLGIVVSDMLSPDPWSCRRLASAAGLGSMTIWAWRQKVSRAFAAIGSIAGKDGRNARVGAGARQAVTVLPESRKASREWVDHQRDPARCAAPDRLR